MVNHVRTLLLNETQASMLSYGRPYGDPWYISPRFSGIDIPSGLVPFRDAMFRGTTTLDDRIARVDALASLLSVCDLEPFLKLMDTRVTTPMRRTASSVLELYQNDSYRSSGFEQEIEDVSKRIPLLYSPVGKYQEDLALPKLHGIATGAFERPLRLAAAVMAFCFQMDRLNSRSHV